MTIQPDSPVAEPDAGELWQGGWYRFARRIDSPNFGPRPPGASIDLIVIHSISLPPGQYGGDQVQRLFTNQLDWELHPYYSQIRGMQVSSHFYIRRNGELTQFVDVSQRAWHAGVSSYRGRANCNDDSIGIELEGTEGAGFEDAQYESLGGLCTAIAQVFPIQHVAGHGHVAPGRKFDPGDGFDWPRLQRNLAWKTQCFPEGSLAKFGL